MSAARKPYPGDVTGDEWAFVAPYSTLLRADAHQRRRDPREVLNAVRWLVKTGRQWRYMPNHFPPWEAVYQQARRWVAAGAFERMAHDLREVLRVAAGRHPAPSAAVLDGRAVPSAPGGGARAGYDGHKERRGSRVHTAVDAPGPRLAARATAASEQERARCST